MGFCEILTLIFIVCKLFGAISWSWWLVLLPEIIAIGGYLLLVVIYALILFVPIIKEIKESKKLGKER